MRKKPGGSARRTRKHGSPSAPPKPAAPPIDLAAIEARREQSHRDRSLRHETEKNAVGRDIPLPTLTPEERALRLELEADDARWLRFFFDRPDMFWYDFVDQQLKMIAAIRHAIVYGGDQGIAASRGEGKSKISERMLLKYHLQGVLRCSILFAATGPKAKDSLLSIKAEVETNDVLARYYPEACIPVRALEGAPARARKQTVTGRRFDNGQEFQRHPTNFVWCGEEVAFADVPGAPSAGGVIATRGLDAEVRGFNKRNFRPSVAIIDDPDTEETVNSEQQAKKLERRIDSGIAFLAGQQRPLARLFISTLQRRECASATYTDPSLKPSFKGRRFRFLLKPPERQDLWEEYVGLWRENCKARDDNGDYLDPNCRGAHQFFLSRYDEMLAGAEVSNPHRYSRVILEDGQPQEVCALQAYYNMVAKVGPDATRTELDNDPPEESGATESGISARRIQKRLSGFAQRVVPPGCTLICQGMDLKKAGSHWVVRAFRPDFTSYTIDYGFHESHGTTYGSDAGIEAAVERVILERMEWLQEHPYLDVEGHQVPVSLTLVDSGWQSHAVYSACAKAGLGILPAKGIGKSNGCIQANFHDVWKRTPDRKPGDGWFMTRQAGNIWLVNCDTDRWKAFEHERWMTSIEKPGAFSIFGQVPGTESRLSDDERAHHSYSHHIVAEVEVEEEVKGRVVRHFKAKSTRNHYLDASYLTNVAASMRGITLAALAIHKKQQVAITARPSLQQLAERAKRSSTTVGR